MKYNCQTSWINLLSKQRNENKRYTSFEKQRLKLSEQIKLKVYVNIDTKGNIVTGSEQIYEADFVCIAGGLYPLAAAVAGCPFRYIPELGGHVPLHSETMETPLSGLFVAGNITGIESENCNGTRNCCWIFNCKTSK